jgi:hypothetical protein
MSATRPRGWRTGPRRRRSREQVQAEQYAVALRAQLTKNAEMVMRAVFAPANARLRTPPVTNEDRAGNLRRAVEEMIAENSRLLGVPADSLGVEVIETPLIPRGIRLELRFLMPEHSDHAHLQNVLRQLAAMEAH